MRTIIEVPRDQLDALEALCKHEGISRAEAVRRAIASYVRREHASATDQAFGLWRKKRGSGLRYQEQRRSEWSRTR